jgi:hypothetical protein
VGAHSGDCAACHQTPDFSDFAFPNTGVSQVEYDAANGTGAVIKLYVPANAEHLADFETFMPASPAHPNATEAFRHEAVAGHSEYAADLGLWSRCLRVPARCGTRRGVDEYVHQQG